MLHCLLLSHLGPATCHQLLNSRYLQSSDLGEESEEPGHEDNLGGVVHGGSHLQPGLDLLLTVILQQYQVPELGHGQQSLSGVVTDLLVFEEAVGVQREQGSVHHIHIGQGKIGSVALIPDEVGIVLEGLQVAGLPPVRDGHSFQFTPVGSNHVVLVLIKAPGSEPAVDIFIEPFGHLYWKTSEVVFEVEYDRSFLLEIFKLSYGYLVGFDLYSLYSIGFLFLA